MTQNIHLISLGCPRNLVDSELMLGRILEQGHQLTGDLSAADFIIINTCGFLEASREEALETIEYAIDHKKEIAKIIVTGCMAQLQPPELEELTPYIHYVLGSGDIDKIIEAIESPTPGSYVSTARSYLEKSSDPRVLATSPHYAYLKIAEGCRKRCTYCIIPDIKGPLRSKSAEQILEEFNALLDKDVWEIVLIAQDLGDWGRDLGFTGSEGLVHLLQQILTIKRDFRIRLLYLYPDEITDELIDLLNADERILPYLDMPIQHINDDILRAMRRKTCKKDITDIVTSLREKVPNISIRTSIMVGFPGETSEQFEELKAWIQEHPLDNIGLFAYSNEPLSQSFSLPEQIDETVKQERCEELMAAQKAIVIERNNAFIGKTIPVIIDGYHPETELLMTGRHIGQAPEIDACVLINDHEAVEQFGEPYWVEITESSDYDLIGRAVEKCKRNDFV